MSRNLPSHSVHSQEKGLQLYLQFRQPRATPCTQKIKTHLNRIDWSHVLKCAYAPNRQTVLLRNRTEIIIINTPLDFFKAFFCDSCTSSLSRFTLVLKCIFHIEFPPCMLLCMFHCSALSFINVSVAFFCLLPFSCSHQVSLLVK